MKKTLVLLATFALPFLAPAADAQPVMSTGPQVVLSTWVPLECNYVGGTEFSSYYIKNTTSATIPKGSWFRFSYNDTTQSFQVQSDVPPGGITRAPTSINIPNTTCKATFNAGDPDIKVTGLRWTSATTATIDVANANPWIQTGSFAVRVGSFNCISTPVKSADSSALVLAKGETKTITVTIAKDGATYLKATADFENKVKESNESNNEGWSIEFAQKCGPK